jgi:hypothetical protein
MSNGHKITLLNQGIEFDILILGLLSRQNQRYNSCIGLTFFYVKTTYVYLLLLW